MTHTALSDSGSPHVREKRRRRREEIRHAALRAFRDKGYHATTLDDIARHVGVRKTALYHYFPDKQTILHECHREAEEELARIIREATALPTAQEQLTHVIREHVRVMTETLEGSPLAFEVTSFSADRQQELIAGRDAFEGAVRRIIERGIRNREFRRVDAKVAVFVILGAINWIARWYRPEGALHAAELGQQYAELLVRGMANRPGRAGVSAPPRRARGRRAGGRP
jgi:AcrR family transcriptional regulator